MLSADTEQTLAELLYQISTTERRVEINRQELCSDPEFSPMLAFEALSCRTISAYDVKHFLKDFSISHSIPNISLLIEQYDSVGSHQLHLADFLQLVVPSENPSLRRITESRVLSFLPLKTKQALATHLSLEIGIQESLVTIKQKLHGLGSFTYMRAFEAINRRGESALKNDQIFEFLRKSRFYVHPPDVNGVIRRIDVDGDGVLSYTEFVKALALPQHLARKQRDMTVKSPQRLLAEPVTGEQHKNHSLTSTKKRNVQGRWRNKSPLRAVSTNLFGESKTREFPFRLTTQLELSRKLEDAKVSLTRQLDFTVLDLYRLVDLEDKGAVGLSDLSSFFSYFFITHTPDDICLIVDHFSARRDSSMRVPDFAELFTPKAEYFAAILRNRAPQTSPPLNRAAVFSQFTLDTIVETLKLIIENERMRESLKVQGERCL